MKDFNLLKLQEGICIFFKEKKLLTNNAISLSNNNWIKN